MSDPCETTTQAAAISRAKAQELLSALEGGSTGRVVPLGSFLELLLLHGGLELLPWQVTFLKALLSSDSGLRMAPVRPRISLAGLTLAQGPVVGRDLKPLSLLSSGKLAGYSCPLVTLDFFPLAPGASGSPWEPRVAPSVSASGLNGYPPSSTPATLPPSSAADGGQKDG